MQVAWSRCATYPPTLKSMHCAFGPAAQLCISLHCTSQHPQTAVPPKSRELCTLVQCYVDLWTLCALQWQSVCSSIVQSCGSTEVRSSRASRRPFPAPGRLSCYPSISTRHLLVPQLSILIHTKSLSISVNSEYEAICGGNIMICFWSICEN